MRTCTSRMFPFTKRNFEKVWKGELILFENVKFHKFLDISLETYLFCYNFSIFSFMHNYSVFITFTWRDVSHEKFWKSFIDSVLLTVNACSRSTFTGVGKIMCTMFSLQVSSTKQTFAFLETIREP